VFGSGIGLMNYSVRTVFRISNTIGSLHIKIRYLFLTHKFVIRYH